MAQRVIPKMSHVKPPYKMVLSKSLLRFPPSLALVTDNSEERFVAKLNCYAHITEEDVANGGFLQTAANSHEVLVEALEKISHMSSTTKLRRVALEALAKLGDTKP